MRDRRHLLVVPIAALLAVLPLVLSGPSCGHDFKFHLLNWLEAGSQWREGVAWPHWEFTTAWNSGAPRFVFYPPFTWMLGALLGLILPWAAVPTTLIWMALTGCGFTMRRLALEWTGEYNALITAAFYMVHPYMLFTFYERAAYGELLAAAWLPLVLLAALRRRPTIPGVAIPVALLWLTNDPAAVMGCYTLALLGAFRVAWAVRSGGLKGALPYAARMAAGTGLGLGLAGFYLVPAVYEQRWVQIAMAAHEGVRVQDNFLFGQFGDASHKAILRTASLCSVVLLVLVAAFAVVALWRGGRNSDDLALTYRKHAVILLLLLASAVALMLNPVSNFLWHNAPELKYLQFPWRFNAVLGAVAAALLALALVKLRLKFVASAATALVCALAFTLGGNHLFRQYCYPGGDVHALEAEFYTGNQSDPSDEYTPVGSDPLAVGHDNPSSWLAASPTGSAPIGLARNYSVALADRLHFDISSAAPAYFVVNLRDYAAWRVTVNGVASVSRPHRPDGLIVLPIGAGRSSIDIAYAHTADQTIGGIVTALAACFLFAAWRMDKPQPPPT